VKITAIDVLELEAPGATIGAAVSGFLIFEHMVLDNPLRDILVPALPQPSRGVIEVPQRPGLGFELDASRVQEFLRRQP
jgi:L-alanine-DL-glutamate epimerase-like enolase superfamily enzyme